MRFHRKALWTLAAFILVLVAATDQAKIGIVAVAVAGIVLELLTWRGVFGRRDKSAKDRKPTRPRVLSSI